MQQFPKRRQPTPTRQPAEDDDADTVSRHGDEPPISNIFHPRAWDAAVLALYLALKTHRHWPMQLKDMSSVWQFLQEI